jgi:hypothetical protein
MLRSFLLLRVVLPSLSGAALPVDLLCKEGHYREFTYLLGGYLPVDSPHYFMVALSGLSVYSSVHIRRCRGPGVAGVTDA